jgi:hypothetical protein
VSETADEAYRSTVERLCEDPRVTETRMMGMPALKRVGKLFGGFHDEALIVRLGRQRVDELIAADLGSAFDPSGRGRPMKDWIAIPLPADAWNDLATEASAYLDA